MQLFLEKLRVVDFVIVVAVHLLHRLFQLGFVRAQPHLLQAADHFLFGGPSGSILVKLGEQLPPHVGSGGRRGGGGGVRERGVSYCGGAERSAGGAREREIYIYREREIERDRER